jgi:glutamate formiminotransferase/formiminotetrahydrofolate cyclodeaminase
MQLIECVPNFSEGKDDKVIGTIAEASKQSATLLDVDSGISTNRTVMTFVGEPSSVLKAAFHAIATAASLIDMRFHHGRHPRMGATDVCPFVPLKDSTMEDCVRLAQQLGERVGSQLKIPVYLYAEAARRPDRINLVDIRKGQYERLAERIQSGEFDPDFGPSTFNAVSGATAIGARPLLIAYNINLDSTSEKIAADIARSIRERGQLKRDVKGLVEADENRVPLRIPGTLMACRAMGWYLNQYKRAQVSTNLIDLKVTSLHHAFDEVARLAQLFGTRVTGSEIVGLVPLKAMLAAGQHYSARQKPDSTLSEKELIQIAIEKLGLNDVRVFSPEKKILEYRIETLKSGSLR